MFCPMCGAPNEEDSIFCGNCGAVLDAEAPAGEVEAKAEAEVGAEADEDIESAGPEPTESERPAMVPPPPPPPRPPRPPIGVAASVPTSGLAIASLVLGIGGLTILPLLGSIAAIILGYMARSDIRQRPGEVSGEGLALAGIVLGWISVGLAVLGLVLVGALGVCGICGAFGGGGFQ
jgi:hypothetical protein